jgi:rhodanese-related sulfurtransferase
MKHSPAFLRIVDDAKSRVRQTTPEEVHERMKGGEQLLLVDVREESEFAAGRIKGAVHVGRGILERDIESKVPDPSTEIILYCGGGFRSALSADNLQKMGYTNVASMDGGWRRWNELGYETEK